MRDISAQWRRIASAAISKGLCPLCREQLIPDPPPFDAGLRCSKHGPWSRSQ